MSGNQFPTQPTTNQSAFSFPNSNPSQNPSNLQTSTFLAPQNNLFGKINPSQPITGFNQNQTPSIFGSTNTSQNLPNLLLNNNSNQVSTNSMTTPSSFLTPNQTSAFGNSITTPITNPANPLTSTFFKNNAQKPADQQTNLFPQTQNQTSIPPVNAFNFQKPDEKKPEEINSGIAVQNPANSTPLNLFNPLPINKPPILTAQEQPDQPSAHSVHPMPVEISGQTPDNLEEGEIKHPFQTQTAKEDPSLTQTITPIKATTPSIFGQLGNSTLPFGQTAGLLANNDQTPGPSNPSTLFGSSAMNTTASPFNFPKSPVPLVLTDIKAQNLPFPSVSNPKIEDNKFPLGNPIFGDSKPISNLQFLPAPLSKPPVNSPKANQGENMFMANQQDANKSVGLFGSQDQNKLTISSDTMFGKPKPELSIINSLAPIDPQVNFLGAPKSTGQPFSLASDTKLNLFQTNPANFATSIPTDKTMLFSGNPVQIIPQKDETVQKTDELVQTLPTRKSNLKSSPRNFNEQNFK